ncbi:hypothetical protein SRHO_G00286930 [Serrasalmus rhombeus]
MAACCFIRSTMHVRLRLAVNPQIVSRKPGPDRKPWCVACYDRGSARRRMSCEVHMRGEGHWKTSEGAQELPQGRGVRKEMKGSFSVGGKTRPGRRKERGHATDTLPSHEQRQTNSKKNHKINACGSPGY